MKVKIFLYTVLLLFAATACSVEDVLEHSDEVNITYLELGDAVTALPGDTVSFKFVASTNIGYLRRIQLVKSYGKFQTIPQSIRFALTDMNDSLKVDKDGFFSRPVKTILLLYPVAVDSVGHEVGETMGATFRVENSSGKSELVDITFRIINYLNNSKEVMLNSRTPYGGYPFYEASTHMSQYRKLDKATTLVYGDIKGVKYFMSPGSEETKKYINAKFIQPWNGKPQFNLDEIELQNTRFMLLEDVDFATFGDKEFAALDFSKASDKVSLKPNIEQVIAFQSQDGRKGILLYYSRWGHYYVKAKYQYLPQ